jgi:hypothetical protein
MDKKDMQERIAANREKAEQRDALKSNVKLLIGGFVAGVAVTLIVGFSTGNFITASHADRMARDAANNARTVALVPYCVASFNESPDAEKNLAALLKTSEWMRGQFIGEGKWAGDVSSSQLNSACAEKLVTEANEAPQKGT